MFLIITIPLTATILPLHFVCFLFLCLQSVFYLYTASLKINYQVSSSLKRKKYIPTQKLQQRIYFGKSKIHIHSIKQKNQLLFQCTNNNCSFAIFLFLHSVCYINTAYLKYKLTFLFAVKMKEIYFNTNLQQKMTKFPFS